MSDLSCGKTTKREFLKIVGLSSASLLASGSLADKLLAQMQNTTLVVPIIRPNAFRLGHDSWFSVTVVFPQVYKAADVDVSSVGCEGARALHSICDPDGRSIAFLCKSGHLRDDLPCGFSVPFTIAGRLSDGSMFEGSDVVAVVGADQSVIYHTSSRRRRSCGACKGHAANRIYSSRQAAENDRPHARCNCRIVEERIGWQDYVRAFWPKSQGDAVVYDRRWGWPPPLPKGLSLEYPPILEEHLRRG